jgi:hypothetical protein
MRVNGFSKGSSTGLRQARRQQHCAMSILLLLLLQVSTSLLL